MAGRDHGIAERAVEVVFYAHAPVHEVVFHLAELGRDGSVGVDDRDETEEAVGRAVEVVLVLGIDAGHLVFLRGAAAVGSLREYRFDVVPGAELGDAVVVEREVLFVGHASVAVGVRVEDRAVARGEPETLRAEAHAAAAGEIAPAEGESVARVHANARLLFLGEAQACGQARDIGEMVGDIAVDRCGTRVRVRLIELDPLEEQAAIARRSEERVLVFLEPEEPRCPRPGSRIAEEPQFLDVRDAVGDELESGPVVVDLVHRLQRVGHATPIGREWGHRIVVIQEVATARGVLEGSPVEVVGDLELRAPVRGIEFRRERAGINVPGILDVLGVHVVAERVRIVGAGPAGALFAHAVEREENAQPVARVVEKLQPIARIVRGFRRVEVHGAHVVVVGGVLQRIARETHRCVLAQGQVDDAT